MIAGTALSRSASSATIIEFLAPPSAWTRLPVWAERVAISRAVLAWPTKETASTPSWSRIPRRLAPAVDEIDDARREDLLIVDQLADPLGGAGVALRGLEDEGVTAGDRVGEEPERDHRGEVEGRYGGDHAHCLADHLYVEAVANLQRLALEQVRNPAADSTD